MVKKKESAKEKHSDDELANDDIKDGLFDDASQYGTKVHIEIAFGSQNSSTMIERMKKINSEETYDN